MWLGFDLCLCSGSVRRLRGAGRVGSGVHGVVRPRRVRGGACGPAVGRWPHWESHTGGSAGVPGAYAACRLGSCGRTCRASACSMGTSLRTEGLAVGSTRCPGGVVVGSGRMSAARDVGANTAWVGCGPGSGAGGSGTTGRRSTVRCQVPRWWRSRTRAMLWRSVWGWVLGGVGTCGGRGGGAGRWRGRGHGGGVTSVTCVSC